MTENALSAYAQAEGMTKSYKKMTEQEKVAVRYKYVLSKLSSASGDFTRTSEGWANQTRVIKLQFESIMSTIGQGIINIFTPLVNIINQALERLQKLAEKFRDFTAKISGKKVTEEGEGAGAAAKAAADATNALADAEESEAEATDNATKSKKKYLSGLDELARFNDDDSDTNEPSIVDIEPFQADEAVPQEEGAKVEGFIDRIKKKFEELKDAFNEGLKLGMGTDVPERLADIKANVLEIEESLKDIFTDPRVIKAVDDFATTAAETLGTIVGAGINIGTGLASMLTGAIADFLSEHKEDIRQHIINMFDVWGDILELVSNLAVAVTEILSPLWQRGREILSDILSIAWEIYSGVTHVASSLFRDILGILITPIVENTDKIREAFDNTLQAIQPVIEGLSTFASSVMSAVVDLYDNHLHPFFTKIQEGLSTILGSLLDGYNTYMAPVLEKIGTKIQELLEGPLSGLATNAIELIGKIIDKVGEIWEQVLVPFFDWIASNIFPVISPIFDFLATTALNALTWILDKLNGFVEWLSNNEAFLEAAGAVLVGLFAGWATTQMVSIIGGIVAAIKGFSVLSTVTGIVSKLGGAFSSVVSVLGGPWGIAIAGVVSAAILVYKNWDKVRAFLEDKLGISFDDIGKKLTELKEFITDKAIAAWGKLKEAMGKVRDYIVNTAIKAWQSFKDGLDNFKTFLADTIMPALNNFREKVLVPLCEYIVDKLKKAFEAIVDYWKNDLGPRLAELGEAMVQFKDNVLDFLVNAFNTVKGAIETLMEWFGKLGESSNGLWQDYLKPLADWVTEILGGAFESLKNILDGLITFLTGVFSGDWEKIWSGLGQIVSGAFGGVLSNIQTIVNGAIGLINKMVSGLETVLGGIVDALNGVLTVEIPSFSLPFGVTTPEFKWSIGLQKPDFSWLKVDEISIPYLARGAVIGPNNPFLAVLGDQKRGKNIEAPLKTIQAALSDVLERNGLLTKLGNNPQLSDKLAREMQAIVNGLVQTTEGIEKEGVQVNRRIADAMEQGRKEIFALVDKAASMVESMTPIQVPSYTGPYLAQGSVVPPSAGYAAAERSARAEEERANMNKVIREFLDGAVGRGDITPEQAITVMLDSKVLFDSVISQGRNAVIRTGRNAFEMG